MYVHIYRLTTDSPLLHIADIYATRNGGLWHREEVHRWLLATCEAVVADDELCAKVNIAYLAPL